MRENFEAIFDTGSTMIVGDHRGIKMLYNKLSSFGTDWSPKYYGDGMYTSTWDGIAADQPPHNV